MARGVSGFYDAFIERYIDCDQFDVCLEKLLDESSFLKMAYFHPYRICKYLIHKYFDVLDEKNVTNYVNSHYDECGTAKIMQEIGDENAQYSTLWLDNLEQVQQASIEELKNIMNEGAFKMHDSQARKLKLKTGMKVLEIGCGLGGLAKHIAEHYDVHVTGVTLSRDMAEHARKISKGLDVDIRQVDYRTLTGKFDRIISIQMIEHVGENRLKEYFQKVHSLLKEDGLFVLQVNQSIHKYVPCYDPAFEKSLQMFCYYPRIEEIIFATKGLFVLEDVQIFGYQLGVSFSSWLKNLETHRERIVAKFGEKNYRATKLLVCSCGAATYTCTARPMEYVFSKNGLRYIYSY